MHHTDFQRQPSVCCRQTKPLCQHWTTLWLSPLPSGLVSEHGQICGQKLCLRYRMSVIYRHPVIAATGVFRFADHATKETEALGTRMRLGATDVHAQCLIFGEIYFR